VRVGRPRGLQADARHGELTGPLPLYSMCADDETFENFDPFTWWKEHTHPEVFRRGHAAYISTAAAPAAATAAPAAAEVDDQFKDAGFAPGDSGWRLLPIIALVVLAVDATSCQAERNFSSLSLTYDELRSSLDPENIEMLMFLKLNSVLIPEVARWRETEQRRSRSASRRPQLPPRQRQLRVPRQPAARAAALFMARVITWKQRLPHVI